MNGVNGANGADAYGNGTAGDRGCDGAPRRALRGAPVREPGLRQETLAIAAASPLAHSWFTRLRSWEFG